MLYIKIQLDHLSTTIQNYREWFRVICSYTWPFSKKTNFVKRGILYILIITNQLQCRPIKQTVILIPYFKLCVLHAHTCTYQYLLACTHLISNTVLVMCQMLINFDSKNTLMLISDPIVITIIGFAKISLISYIRTITVYSNHDA